MCKRAQTDPDPQLRCAAMTLTYHLAEHLPNTFLGDAKGGSRSISAMPSRTDPLFADVHLLQCKLYPVAMMLAEDDNYSVRLAVAAQCDRLAKALGEHWHVVIIDLLQAMLGDKDDRVRGEAVLCIPRLLESIVAGMSYAPGQNIFVLDSLLPVALKLKKDPVVDVRISLAAAAGELLSILVGIYVTEETTGTDKGGSKDQKYIDGTLIPLLQELLQDKNAEVTTSALRAVTNASKSHVTRERTASKVFEDDSVSLSSHASHIMEKKDPVFRPVLSEDQVLRLIPTLSELSSSSQWRVRQSAVEIVPALLGCTHKIETRLEIAQLCKTLMNDSVDAVRYSAAECLCLGGSNIGSGEFTEAETWLSTVVLPHMEACRDSKLSKQRVLCLKMIEMVLLDVARPNSSTHANQSILGLNVSIRQEDDDKSNIVKKVLAMGASLIEDPIVNVRLNVGRAYGNVVNLLSDDDLDYIISTLEKQIETESVLVGDHDVLYFARRGIILAKDNKTLKNDKDTFKSGTYKNNE
jgi:HEAT repeat protein